MSMKTEPVPDACVSKKKRRKAMLPLKTKRLGQTPQVYEMGCGRNRGLTMFECSDSKNRVQGEKGRAEERALEQQKIWAVLECWTCCEPSCQLTHCLFCFWIICSWTHVLELTLPQKWEVTFWLLDWVPFPTPPRTRPDE